MTKILNKCPICGGRLEYSMLMQFTKDYQIKLNGKLTKKSKNSMEDRYLFKAKRIDNGEWVLGALLLHDDAATIFNQNPADGSLQGFEVDPFTICQCTGLKDKNGKLI